MSLQLLRQTVKSPFQLQRSMVDQGGAGGAYESGGFTGKSQYSDGGMAAAISSFGNSIAAGIDSISDKDMNKMNEKKAARLEARGAKTEVKKQNALKSGDLSKADRMLKRGERVEARLGETNKKIEEYKQSKNPTLESDIKPVKPKTETPKEETSEETDAVSKNPSTKPVSSIEGGSTNSLSFKDRLQSVTDFNNPINQKKKKKY
jgi:hypothetical protein